MKNVKEMFPYLGKLMLGGWMEMQKTVQLAMWIIVLMVCCPVVAHAQGEYSLETIPNVRLLDRAQHVSNPNYILQEAYVDSINRVLTNLEENTGIEVAVVAVLSVKSEDVRLFASDLFNRWGIGKKGKDNGLLIMLVTKPEQRAVVFETGYGIEGVLPDATCFRIQQDFMLPDMKEGDYGRGMYKGVKQVAYLLSGKDQAFNPSEGSEDGDWVYALILMLIITPIFIFFVYLVPIGLMNLTIYLILTAYRRLWPQKCPHCHKRSLWLKHEKITKWPSFKEEGNADQLYVCSHCGHQKKSKRSIYKITWLGYFSHMPIHSSSGGGGGLWGGGSSGGGGSISRF